MTAYPKRLIEVDLPIKRISAHARREKSIRHGHISTLHIWWARRPLAACRAVICAALWPDPVDELCPQKFRDLAAELITEFAKTAATDGKLLKHCSTENWNKWKTLAQPDNLLDSNNPDHWNVLRFALLDFIADFANWDNSKQSEYLQTSRALTKVAHEVCGGIPGTRPLVVDPFAGGGAIPLEALRVGADSFASDLNPVALTLNKVVLEYVPKYGQRLADTVKKRGEWIQEEFKKKLEHFYSIDMDGNIPIAYLWARTIFCEGPGCGTEIPLMRTLWLSKKGNQSVALQIQCSQPHQTISSKKEIDFRIIKKHDNNRWFYSDNPSEELYNPQFEGTVKRGSVTCPCCGYTTPVSSVRQQLRNKKGGSDSARMFCVVSVHPDKSGRFFHLPTNKDFQKIQQAKLSLSQKVEINSDGLSLLPDENLPPHGSLGFRVQLYGMTQWKDLFTSRQLLALTTLVELVSSISQKFDKGEEDFAVAVQTCLALAINRLADRCSSLCRYDPSPTMSGINNTFSRQAVSMVWDFGEGDPTSDRSGGWKKCLDWLVPVLEYEAKNIETVGTVMQASATMHPLPDDSSSLICTDPPYYDAVPYSDLSDFFYVWLKRSLPKSLQSLFTETLAPKIDECIVDPVKGKDKYFFERTMAQAMLECRRVVSPDGLGIIVFAHKSTAGWEAQLQAIIDSGWTITGSWPIDTEMATRLRARDSAALASSVHLVCRPRENSDGTLHEVIGDWRDVLQELPHRIHAWMPRLADEGVVGADAIFACLGPALEIFSRYSSVEKASGEEVTLKEYLEYVWAAVSKEALSMIFENADTAGFEEDARLTAMWLWTLSTDEQPITKKSEEEDTPSKTNKFGGYILEYDAARKIAQGLGAHLEQLSTLINIQGEKAQLLPVADRAASLFGKADLKAPTKRKAKNARQLSLMSKAGSPEDGSEDWGDVDITKLGNTVLDRVHQSMILFATGRSEALKRFLVDEGVGADQRYWTLAQALTALYPPQTDEKRWVDGVLARKKGLGF